MIYDQNTFVEAFLKDLEKASNTIVIVSPYVTARRVRWLESVLLDKQQNKVDVAVYTRPARCFLGKSMQSAQTAIDLLASLGVRIHYRENIHQKHAVIDGQVVWYGSVNLLSFGTSQESIMRLSSGSVAKALEMK